MSAAPLRVVVAIADDDVRINLVARLERLDSVHVTGVAGNPDQLQQVAGLSSSSLILLGADVLAAAGPHLGTGLARVAPHSRQLVLLNGRSERQQVHSPIDGQILIPDSQEALAAVLNRIAAGRCAPIRLLIADDDRLVRDALASVFSTDPRIDVVATAADAGEAVDRCDDTVVDVALLDVSMPGGGGAWASERIRAAHPSVRIVALSAAGDEMAIGTMLESGADGYLLKSSDVDDIISAVHRAADGEPVASSALASALMAQLVRRVSGEREQHQQHRDWRKRIEMVLGDGLGLSIAYQPILDLQSERMVGVEALARFSSEPRQTPDKWFAAAWEVGLGPDLELLAVHAACHELPHLPPGTYISLNLTPDPQVLRRFAEDFASTPLDQVVIEITEHAAVEDYPALLTEMNGLRERGARFAVDDTGAGYASLRHILQLEPEILKLDISLTRGIDEAHPQRALAAALVAFGAAIHCRITAEGVETVAERDALTALGVHAGQGYLFAKPAPFDSLVAFMANITADATDG